MCSRSRIMVSSEATLRAFSETSNRLERSEKSRGFIVRYPLRQPVAVCCATHSAVPGFHAADGVASDVPSRRKPLRSQQPATSGSLNQPVLSNFIYEALSCGKATHLGASIEPD